MNKILLFSLALVLACTSCKVKEPASTKSSDTRDGYTEIPQQSVMEEEETLQKTPDCVALITDESTFKKGDYIETEVLSYAYNQGCVCITYAYSGCGEKEVQVLWKKSEEDKSHNPPKAMLSLMVENPGMCEAYFTDSICISTEQLKLYGNEIMLQFPKEDQNLLLQFQY